MADPVTPTLTERIRRLDAADAASRVGTDRDTLIGELKDIYQRTGEEATDIEIERAIDAALSGSNPAPTPPGAWRALATAYIHRSKIFWYGIMPAMTLAASIGLMDYAVDKRNESRLRAQEARAEEAVEEAYLHTSDATREIDATLAHPVLGQLPDTERAKIQRITDAARTSVDAAVNALTPYLREGQADDVVTSANMSDASSAAARAREHIENGLDGLPNAARIYEEQATIERTATQLETLIKEIRAMRAPATLIASAESAYDAGRASVDGRNTADATRHIAQLQATRDDAGEFTALSNKPQQLYASIIAEAKVDDARARGEDLYARATAHLQAANVPALRETLAAMESLDARLREEYDLIPTKARLQGEMKNGVDRREWKIVDGRKVDTGNINWYKFVKAVDPSTGADITVTIHNEECDVVDCGGPADRQVSVFGLRITDGRLEQIKRDLQDNGLFDDPVHKLMGRKERGHLDITCNVPEGCPGYITEW